jgi:hypothetical protein
MTEPRREEPRPPGPALEAAQGALYAVSLPERALRAMVGTASGLLRESARAAVPDAMKGSKLYELTVRKMLGFLIRDVGGFEGVAAEKVAGSYLGPAVEGTAVAAPVPEGSEFLVKKALGNALDIAGIATLHVSPLWVIAVFSDIVHGARTYLHALGEELRARGVIAKDAQFEGVDGLLKAIQTVSGAVADNLDTPPVTVSELEKMVKTLREESKKVDLRHLLPEQEVANLWSGIQEAARLEGRSPFEVSSAMAMMVYNQLLRVGQGAVSTVKVGFDILNDNVISYYLTSLAELSRKGYYQSLLEASGPYLRGLRHLFEPSRETYTEKVLKGKPLRALWQALRRWCARRRMRRRQAVAAGAESPRS